jgi:hypothetical protein
MYHNNMYHNNMYHDNTYQNNTYDDNPSNNNKQVYYVYEPNELIDKLDSIETPNIDVENFIKNFTFSEITNQQVEKGNSTMVFNKIIKEDTTKAKIIGCLNKLSQHNLTKIANSIRDITFQTTDELDELVYQCIQKIKKENELIRPLVAALCQEFLSLHFITSEGDKIYFRKLLLTEVRKEYLNSCSYDSDDWTKDKAEKIMILIGTLYNGKIIEDKIMSSIIEDFKKNIKYTENGTQEDYERVEKAIQLLSCLVLSIVLNDDSKKIFTGLEIFLKEQLVIYENIKCISKKVRIICKNIVFELVK